MTRSSNLLTASILIAIPFKGQIPLRAQLDTISAASITEILLGAAGTLIPQSDTTVTLPIRRGRQ